MFGKINKAELYKKGVFAGIAEILYIILVVSFLTLIGCFAAVLIVISII